MTADISFIAALTAGLLSFFSPCILPLIPSYLSYMLGDYAKAKEKKIIFLQQSELSAL